MVVAAERIRTLNKYEKSILVALERGMKRYAWVPLDHIKLATKLSESEVNYRLSRLIEWGMVRFNPVPYDGYSLVFGGYDTLALSTLAKKGIISALGSRIGEGKESVVYEALGLGPVAIKFHRIGLRSFSSVPGQPGIHAGGRPLSLADCITEISGTGIPCPDQPAPEGQRSFAHCPEPPYCGDGIDSRPESQPLSPRRAATNP